MCNFDVIHYLTDEEWKSNILNEKSFKKTIDIAIFYISK